MEKLLATIPEASQAIGHGRSYLYELIRDGKVEAVKSGRRRLVVVELIQRYVNSLRKRRRAVKHDRSKRGRR